MTFRHVGAGLTGLVARWIDDEELHWRLVCQAWRAAAGEVVALHATPGKLCDATLHVRVDSAAWRRTLVEIESQLLARLQQELGAGLVERLTWESDEREADPT